MDALYPINPALLFFIQGPSQLNQTGVPGSSYITNLPNAVDSTGSFTADPNAFFKQVLIKDYVDRVAVAISN